MSINLVKFKAKTKVEDAPGVVTLTTSGTLRFGILACEEIGITKDSYLNCHFDSDNQSHAYLEITKHSKSSVDGYRASSTVKREGSEETGIVFNPGAFIRRLQANHQETTRYEYEIVKLGEKDYIKIDFSNPIKSEVSSDNVD